MQNKFFHDDDANVIMKNIDDSSSITSMKDNKTNKNIRSSHNHNQSTLSSMRKLSMSPIDLGATSAATGATNPSITHVVNQLSLSSHSTRHLLLELLKDEKEDASSATNRNNIETVIQQQQTYKNNNRNHNQEMDDESSSFISKLIRRSNSQDDFYNDDDTINTDQYALLTSGGDGEADDIPVTGVLSKPSLPPKEIFGGIDIAQKQPEGVSSSIGFKNSNRISPIECDQEAHDDTSSICTIPITAQHRNCSDEEEVALNGGFVSNSSICSSVVSRSSHSGDGCSGKSSLLSSPTVGTAITPIKSNRKRRSFIGDLGDSQEEQEGHKKMKTSPLAADSIASHSKKKIRKFKESISSNTNSPLQDEKEHRSIVSAIFNIGLQHSSPLSLFDTMSEKCQHQLPEGLNLERIKSKLQKYRNKREQSKEEFMTLYDQTMDYFLRAKTISFSKQMEQGEGEQGGKARKTKNKNHKIVQRQPCMESLNASEIAAFLSFSILKEEGKCTVPLSNECCNDLESISPSSILNSVNYEGHGALIMPELTEVEKNSPIGRAFDNFMLLFEATRASFQMSTQFKYTPQMSAADGKKLDTKVASSTFTSGTGSWFQTDNRVLSDTSTDQNQRAQLSHSDNNIDENSSKMRYRSRSSQASISSSKRMQPQQLPLGPPSTITTKDGTRIQPNYDHERSYLGHSDQYFYQYWNNSPYYFLNQASRYPHANHHIWNMHPNKHYTKSYNTAGKSFSRDIF